MWQSRQDDNYVHEPMRVPPAQCTQCTRACAFGCVHESRCTCGAASHHITVLQVLGRCFAAFIHHTTLAPISLYSCLSLRTLVASLSGERGLCQARIPSQVPGVTKLAATLETVFPQNGLLSFSVPCDSETSEALGRRQPEFPFWVDLAAARHSPSTLWSP